MKKCRRKNLEIEKWEKISRKQKNEMNLEHNKSGKDDDNKKE